MVWVVTYLALFLAFWYGCVRASCVFNCFQWYLVAKTSSKISLQLLLLLWRKWSEPVDAFVLTYQHVRGKLQASTAWIASDSNCNWQREFFIDKVSKSGHSCCCLLRGAAMWTEQCWLSCTERTLLVIFRCRSRAGITFRTTDWRSTEECCACGPRFTLQFLQMLHFNCFLLCIWKRFFLYTFWKRHDS